MITDDQITALAREYAEEMIKGKPSEELPNCLKNSMMAMNTEYIAEVFQWLTRRFCLVEKSKITEEYKRAIETNRKGKETGAHSLCTMGSTRKILLEFLFPEIAKEVES